MNARSCALLVAMVSASLAACSSSSSNAGSSSAASSAAPPAKSTPAPPASSAAPPRKAEGPKSLGEVDLRSVKKKVAFSIQLPEGLKEFSESGETKTFRKEKDKYDTYGFTISEAPPEFMKAGLEDTLARLEKDPDFVKNKVKILDKAKSDTGWYFVHSLEEGAGKKAVSVMLMVTKGDVSLECHAEVEGPLADKAEESAKAMLEVCKTLAITVP